MTVKLFRINTGNPTNELDWGNSMIGFTNSEESVRLFVVSANTQKCELLSSLAPIAFWEY